MLQGEAIQGESAMPKVTKAGRVAPVAGQDQAINFQRNQLMIIQAR